MMCCSCGIILRNSLTGNFRSKIFLLTLCLCNTLESYEVQLRISTAACCTLCTESSCTKALQLVGLISSGWSEFTWHGNMICSSVKLFLKKVKASKVVFRVICLYRISNTMSNRF